MIKLKAAAAVAPARMAPQETPLPWVVACSSGKALATAPWLASLFVVAYAFMSVSSMLEATEGRVSLYVGVRVDPFMS